jgi:hypothetical protein
LHLYFSGTEIASKPHLCLNTEISISHFTFSLVLLSILPQEQVYLLQYTFSEQEQKIKVFKELVIHAYLALVPRRDMEINIWRVGTERANQCMTSEEFPTQGKPWGNRITFSELLSFWTLSSILKNECYMTSPQILKTGD